MDKMLNYLRDHPDEVMAALAVVALFQLAIIFLWARHATQLRRRLAVALEAAESAKRTAAAALTPTPARLVIGGASAGPAVGGERALGTVARDAGRPVYRVASGPSEQQPALPSPAAVVGGVPPAEPAAAPVPLATELSERTPTPEPAQWRADLTKPLDDGPQNKRAAAASAWARMDTTGGNGSLSSATPAAPSATAPSPPASPVGPRESSVPSWLSEPAAPAPADPPPTPALTPRSVAPTTPAAPAGRGNDVLLVEDDENVGKLYSLLLESHGYHVRRAEDGVVGLEEAQRQRPDLILLDIMMPRMNGIMFLQSMRTIDAIHDVPVVVLSNFSEPRLVEQAMSLGALEYMVKAKTRPEALARAVPRWMRGERYVAS